jgi:hypothetical protein
MIKIYLKIVLIISLLNVNGIFSFQEGRYILYNPGYTLTPTFITQNFQQLTLNEQSSVERCFSICDTFHYADCGMILWETSKCSLFRPKTNLTADFVTAAAGEKVYVRDGEFLST